MNAILDTGMNIPAVISVAGRVHAKQRSPRCCAARDRDNAKHSSSEQERDGRCLRARFCVLAWCGRSQSPEELVVG